MITCSRVRRAKSALMRIAHPVIFLGAVLLVGCTSSRLSGPASSRFTQFESDCLAAPQFEVGEASVTPRGEPAFVVPVKTLLPSMDSLNSVCRVIETDDGIRLQECQVRIVERGDSLAWVIGVQKGYRVLDNHRSRLREFAKSDVVGTRRAFLRPVLLR